eukprot:gene32556-36758_t
MNPEIESINLYSRGTFQINADHQAFFEAGYSERDTAFTLTPSATSSTVVFPGANGGANGKWTLNSNKQIVVTSEAPNYDPGSYPSAGGMASSPISSQALGRALGQGTDVTLASGAANAEGGQEIFGVVFDTAAQVVKNEGGNASLRVDSATGIAMLERSTIQSKTGALHVDFNADANGPALPAGDAPIVGEGAARIAPIQMTDAVIETNGGNVRFYGQGDAQNGRALGYANVSFSSLPFSSAGVQVTGGRISTCAMGAASCAQGGEISLRGAGQTVLSSSYLVGSTGVLLASTELISGSGAITVDGTGGLLDSTTLTFQIGASDGEKMEVDTKTDLGSLAAA